MKIERKRMPSGAAAPMPPTPAPMRRQASDGLSSRFAVGLVETEHGTLEVRQSAGTGLAVLLLHGNSGAKEVFDGLLEGSLARGHRLIAVDLPGHGGSEDAWDPAKTYSIPGYADAVCQVLEALDVDRIVLVGWSLGGHVALEMIACMPGVVGAFLMGTPPLSHGAGALAAAFRAHPALQLLGRVELLDEDLKILAAAATNTIVATRLLPAMRRADGRARAHLFDSLLAGRFEDETAILDAPNEVPVALVFGEEDPLVNLDAARAVATRNLWGGRCHVVPGCGHAPFIDAPNIVNQLLVGFMADMVARAGHLDKNPALALGG